MKKAAKVEFMDVILGEMNGLDHQIAAVSRDYFEEEITYDQWRSVMESHRVSQMTLCALSMEFREVSGLKEA